jgi:hypothetical protein
MPYCLTRKPRRQSPMLEQAGASSPRPRPQRERFQRRGVPPLLQAPGSHTPSRGRFSSLTNHDMSSVERGYNDDDDEDSRRAVLWPGFGIVGAMGMVKEGENKELDYMGHMLG